MTKIKFCGLKRICDIEAANELKPDFIGFVFWPKSKRYVTPDTAADLKSRLSPEIKAVGVFIDEDVCDVARLLNENIIDIAQLHGSEDEEYMRKLRELSGKPIIRAVQIHEDNDITEAKASSAEYVLLDSGTGGGKKFDWRLLADIDREYFLAGGLDCSNVAEAIKELHPFAVDVSSGIETNGVKDIDKMKNFLQEVRKGDLQ